MSLEIGGVEIPVERISETQPYIEGEDYGRRPSGVPVDLSYGTRRRWLITTAFMEDSEFDTVNAKLDLRTRQAIGGTLPGVTDIDHGRIQILGLGYRGGQGYERSIRFQIEEDEA